MTRPVRLFVLLLLCIALPARAVCVWGEGCHGEPHAGHASAAAFEPVFSVDADLVDVHHGHTHLHWVVAHDHSAHDEVQQTDRICANLCAAFAVHRTPVRTGEPILLARLTLSESAASFVDANLALPKRPPRSS